MSSTPEGVHGVQVQTKSSSIVYGLQVLRAVAALLVVVRHSAKSALGSETAFAIGQCGVDIFFVISGVVIYLTGRKLTWHVFLRRRVARIVPLYWLITLLVIPIALFRGLGSSPYWLSNLLLSLAFLPSTSPTGSILPPLFVGWTLNFEMAFYLVCVGVLLVRPRISFHAAVSVVIVGVILLGLPILGFQQWRLTPATFFLLPISIEFVAGLWLAHLWVSGRRSSVPACIALFVTAILWLAIAPVSSLETVWRPLGWGIPAIAIVWATLSLENKLDFARWKIGLALGDSSYALYLVHPLVLGATHLVLRRFMAGTPLPVEIAVLVIISILAGLVLHYVIELRLLSLANRMLGLKKKAGQIGARSGEFTALQKQADA